MYEGGTASIDTMIIYYFDSLLHADRTFNSKLFQVSLIDVKFNHINDMLLFSLILLSFYSSINKYSR